MLNLWYLWCYHFGWIPQKPIAQVDLIACLWVRQWNTERNTQLAMQMYSTKTNRSLCLRFKLFFYRMIVKWVVVIELSPCSEILQCINLKSHLHCSIFDQWQNFVFTCTDHWYSLLDHQNGFILWQLFYHTNIKTSKQWWRYYKI